MEKIRNKLLTRITWLVFFSSIGVLDFVLFVATRRYNLLMSGLGFVIMGAASFLQPIAFGTRLKSIIAESGHWPLARKFFGPRFF